MEITLQSVSIQQIVFSSIHKNTCFDSHQDTWISFIFKLIFPSLYENKYDTCNYYIKDIYIRYAC